MPQLLQMLLSFVGKMACIALEFLQSFLGRQSRENETQLHVCPGAEKKWLQAAAADEPDPDNAEEIERLQEEVHELQRAVSAALSTISVFRRAWNPLPVKRMLEICAVMDGCGPRT